MCHHGVRVSPLRSTAAWPLLALVLALGCDKAQLVPLDAGPMLGPGAQVPLPPDRTSDAEDAPALVFALRDVVLRQGAGIWEDLGWNLDDRCSYDPAPPAADAGLPDGAVPDAGPYAGWDIECAPQNMGDAPAGDGDMCRDNNYGQFISLGLETLGVDVQEEANETIGQGEYTFLLRITHYNGRENDPQVTVEAVQTAFGVPAGGARGDPLAWDGTDTFYPATTAFDDRGEPVLIDRTAYVIDSLLVMRIPPRADFQFSGSDRSLSIRITDGTLTGRLEGGFLEDVVIAGRWPVADIVNELDDLGVCAGDSLRMVVENAVRGSADVLSNPEATPGALPPCDAVSMAVGFRGVPGRWGKPPQDALVLPDPCP
jgi:hypothetical protein